MRLILKVKRRCPSDIDQMKALICAVRRNVAAAGSVGPAATPGMKRQEPFHMAGKDWAHGSSPVSMPAGPAPLNNVVQPLNGCGLR